MSTIPTEPSAERCEFPGCPNCPGVDRACKFAPAPPQEAPGVREALEAALKQTWKMVDPLHPPGAPGSYARGEHNGICAALTTLRENFERIAARAALSGKKD